MSTFRLDGKTALVTGASRAASGAASRSRTPTPAPTSPSSRATPPAHRGRGGGRVARTRALVLPADVTDIEAVQSAVGRAVHELGQVDVLVNNAGGNSFPPARGHALLGWEKTIRLNLDSTVHVSRALLPHLLERKTGVVINVASVAGLRGAPMMSHYAAAKAAVISLSQSLALETAWAGSASTRSYRAGSRPTSPTSCARARAPTPRSLSCVAMQRWGRSRRSPTPRVPRVRRGLVHDRAGARRRRRPVGDAVAWRGCRHRRTLLPQEIPWPPPSCCCTFPFDRHVWDGVVDSARRRRLGRRRARPARLRRVGVRRGRPRRQAVADLDGARRARHPRPDGRERRGVRRHLDGRYVAMEIVRQDPSRVAGHRASTRRRPPTRGARANRFKVADQGLASGSTEARSPARWCRRCSAPRRRRTGPRSSRR